MNAATTAKSRRAASSQDQSPAEPQKTLAERAAADGPTQEAMEALRTTQGWQRWLGVRCHLGNLALVNQAVIANARPAARRAAGRRTWQTLGYEVRSEQKAIYLWAHVPDGEPILVPVFDQDQVRPFTSSPEGIAAEPAPATNEASLIGFLGQLIKFASEIGAPVSFEPIASAVRSYHEPGTGAIVIDASPDHPLPARTYRLAYELASVLIDDDPRRSRLCLSETERVLLTRSVAYCTCAFTRSAEHRSAIAVPAEWERNGPLAVRYAALADRVTHRLEAALSSTPGERCR
jgi:hypothetical protein